MRASIFILLFCFGFPFFLQAQADGAKDEKGTQPFVRGDALRRSGDYEGALAAYQEELRSGRENAQAWKKIANVLMALRRYREAAGAFEKALTLDRNDREARDDLAGLQLSRGLAIRTWYGGNEPDGSRNAAEGQLWYGGLDRLELVAGGAWTDNAFYESNKGYAGVYWFYSGDSFAKLNATLLKYNYFGGNKPIPDSNAYEFVPRGEIEISHWFTKAVRTGLIYQIQAPNFQYDPSTRIVNHKLTGELEVVPGGGFRLTGTAAFLRDPDPGSTVIANSPSNPGGATSVAFRIGQLYGAGASYQADKWAVGLRGLTNRDLDSSYDWSIISSLDFLPLNTLSLNLQWIFDRYSANSGPVYSGKNGNIGWLQARYKIIPGLVLGGGLKYVGNPGPTGPTDSSARNGLSLQLNLEYATGLF